MTIWTMQPVEVFDLLKKDKILYCDETKATYLADEGIEFRTQYNWMTSQIIKRIGKPPIGVNYPFWAWHTRDWKHKKPDLREIGYGYKGEKSVRLELEMTNEEVVLSDEEEWHYVLNNFYLGDAESEDEWDKEQEVIDALPELERQKAIEISWEKIFDLNTVVDTKWKIKGRYIQATFWSLRYDQVKNIRYFTAR